MRIYECRPEQSYEIARVMEQFSGGSEFVTVDIEYTAATYARMIAKDQATFLTLEVDNQIVGGLGCIRYPDLHNGLLTAVETVWFVHPDHRGYGMKLFDAFEEWAKKHGCKRLAMIHMVDSYPEILEKLYQRRGYKLIEKHYLKEISP